MTLSPDNRIYKNDLLLSIGPKIQKEKKDSYFYFQIWWSVLLLYIAFALFYVLKITWLKHLDLAYDIKTIMKDYCFYTATISFLLILPFFYIKSLFNLGSNFDYSHENPEWKQENRKTHTCPIYHSMRLRNCI